VSFVPPPNPPAARRARALDRDRVIRGARELLEEAGLDELTMRRLAEHLGTKVASLYRHVRDKDEVLALVAEDLCSELPAVAPDGSWQEQLRALAWSFRAEFARRRDAARLLASTPPIGPRRLALIEVVLSVLRRSGLGDRDVAWAAYHFNNLVTEFAADEARFASLQREGSFDDARQRFASLPDDRFPTVVALAEHLASGDADGLFRFGVDLWIGGLERLVP
jgi:AcrR family transcriptional regulator